MLYVLNVLCVFGACDGEDNTREKKKSWFMILFFL